MKNNILRTILLALALILFAAALYVYRPTSNRTSRVTVVGDAETRIAPDTAVITFSVVTQNAQAFVAQQENARRSEAVKTAIETGFAAAAPEIKTNDYNLSPEQDYGAARMPKIIGYEVKNTVVVSIGDLQQVGAVIDAATKAGANSVEGISFVVRENSPAHGVALGAAAKQALTKAEAAARALGGKIVRVVETREAGAPSSLAQDNYSAMSSNSMMAAKPAYRTPVQAGSLDVRSQVVLTVEVEADNND